MLYFLKFALTFLLLPVSVLPQTCDGRSIFTFKMHHRFSNSLKNWSASVNGYFHLGKWPAKRSFEYYEELAHRDHILRGRKLSNGDSPLAFSDGNTTFRISSLGFLHYTTVELGTPGVKFMVALDTGSDLFWVPSVNGLGEVLGQVKVKETEPLTEEAVRTTLRRAMNYYSRGF